MRNVLFFMLAVIVFSLSAYSVSALEEEWNEMKSYHFVVYYKQTPEDFVETVLNAAEEYYDQITSDLGFNRYKGWTFDERAKIYVYDSQEDYVESARQSNWSAGAAYYNSRTIRTYPSIAGFFDSLLPHELGHIIFHEFIGVTVEVPTWFDEGVAMFQEKAKRWGSNAEVKKTFQDGTFMPLERLSKIHLTRESSRELVDLFYAESASIVYFLIQEQGQFRFLNFCRKLNAGDKFDHAFELSYPSFNNLERLNKAWVEYLERQ